MATSTEMQLFEAKVCVGDVMVCERCGLDITRRTRNQRVCESCREFEKRRRDRERQRKPTTIGIGEIMQCEECGELLKRHSGNQKYCLSCSEYLKSVKRETQECRGHANEASVTLILNTCPHCGVAASITAAFKIWVDVGGIKMWRCACTPTETLTWEMAIVDFF